MARVIGIRVHRGSELVDTQVFERDIIKIGRLASAHLRLEDPKVSRIHAVIDIAAGNEVSIIDMGSAEGTRVNGEKVSRVRLKHGDEVALGDSRLVVVLDDAELLGLRGAEGAGAVAASAAVVAAPEPTSPAASGVFSSGPTNVEALRAELSTSLPAPQGTDVFLRPPDLDVSTPLTPGSQPISSQAPMTRPAMAPPVMTPAQPLVMAPPLPTPLTVPPRAATPRAAPTQPPLAPVDDFDGVGLPPLPPIPEDAITPENRFIEVTLFWQNDAVEVKRIRNQPAFSIGKGPGDELFIPLEGLGVGESFKLLSSSEGGGWTVHFTPQMTGTVRRGDNEVPLNRAGQGTVQLTDDTIVTVVFAQFSVQVRPVPRSRIVPIVPLFDLLWANTAVITMFATAAMLSVVTLMPIGLDSLDDDLFTNPAMFQTLILKPPPKDNSFLKKLGAKEQKQAAKNDQGKAGDKKADPNKDKGKMATKAKEKPNDEQIVTSKLNALFGDKGSGGMAELLGDSSGGALEAALGGIDGAKVATGFGAGGLGFRGGGPGGGGVGVGTLGSGRVGTRGRGSGEAGYGSGEGGMGKKTDRDVSMTQGTPVILGSLDPEIIRRIVREHAGQIRYCYERELTNTPGIAGKIIMKWVINGEGKVTQAQTAETQMKNANVESCLASRIKGWVFPKPKGGGIVIVNYPFVFKQSG